MIELKSKETVFNQDRLTEILTKLGIKDEKILNEIIETLRNHKNRNEIIDILGSILDLKGSKRTHENLYWLYRFNRDLLQLGSPVWSEPRDYVDDLEKFHSVEEEWSINDIIYDYLELQYMKGLPYDDEWRCKPSKRNVEAVLRYLMGHCRIYSFDLGGVYDCPAMKHKEYDDWLSPGHTVKVIRII